MSKKFPITITDNAMQRIEHILNNITDIDVVGIKVGTKTAGCSGLKYNIDYIKVNDISPLDESLPIRIDDKNYQLVIDSTALMNLIGTTMDYVQDELKSEFVFNNPNAKGQCGCGESFYI